MDQTNEPSLESAIIDEAGRVIADIARKEAAEIKKLDEAYAAELEDFKTKTMARTETRIRQESSKVENRAGVDLKKFKLRTVEAFISRMVADVAKEIRDNPHYKRFLLAAISDAIGRIPTGAEVRLKSEDLACEREIRDALEVTAGSREIAVVEDKTITWGGCIIVDVAGGRIFDSTIERITFRKSSAIRREVMTLLNNPPARTG